MNLMALSADTSNANEPVDHAVKTVGSMAKVIDEYGGYIAILSLFIIILVITVITIIWINTKLMKQELEEKLALLSSQKDQNEKLVDHLLKDNSSKDTEDEEETEDDIRRKNRKDFVSTYIDINLILKDAVRSASGELNAERVGIYVFHNGNQSIHGLPFFKVSCMHEWNKAGSLAMKTRAYRSVTHQSIPLYLLSDIVESIYSKKYYFVTNIQDKIDSVQSLQTFVDHSDIQTMYMLAISDDDDNIAGFVIAEFKEIINLEDEAMNKIKHTLEITRDTVKPVVINLNNQFSIHESE